jgi:NAD(P)-dependent dehydrogenase (short-subunit alcohol dehydrogenase family)
MPGKTTYTVVFNDHTATDRCFRYGLSGPFETLSDEQIRQQMEINFFGLLDVTRKAMETMRDLKTGGVIQQVTSIGGQIGKFIITYIVRGLLNIHRCTKFQRLLCKQVGR